MTKLFPVLLSCFWLSCGNTAQKNQTKTATVTPKTQEVEKVDLDTASEIEVQEVIQNEVSTPISKQRGPTCHLLMFHQANSLTTDHNTDSGTQ